MEIEKVMAALAESYWGRHASEPELLAMTGELRRDSASIAPSALGRGGALFTVEPAHYDALMQAEAKR
ncbi:hypothetical protein [Rhizobium sp. FY34]|uniref:hypothetical protein n=1 Tax=Rhizobium sp. FY34 TaxID=2562309 RepID=UPI0010C003BB|nr:hypothetical protein [Rhizobium sp. FY34]